MSWPSRQEGCLSVTRRLFWAEKNGFSCHKEFMPKHTMQIVPCHFLPRSLHAKTYHAKLFLTTCRQRSARVRTRDSDPDVRGRFSEPVVNAAMILMVSLFFLET